MKYNWTNDMAPRDKQCGRPACVFAPPFFSFAVDRRRVVVVWGWIDVQTVDVPKGLRIDIAPAVAHVALSSN